jgi:hypothetical protein
LLRLYREPDQRLAALVVVGYWDTAACLAAMQATAPNA